MSHSIKYSVIETPLNKWAVIYPMDNFIPNANSRVWFPSWLPANHSHMGIFNTLDEALTRMENLRESEGISL